MSDSDSSAGDQTFGKPLIEEKRNEDGRSLGFMTGFLVPKEKQQ